MITFEGVRYRYLHDERKQLIADICAKLIVIERDIRKCKQGKINITGDLCVSIDNFPDEMKRKIIKFLDLKAHQIKSVH